MNQPKATPKPSAPQRSTSAAKHADPAPGSFAKAPQVKPAFETAHTPPQSPKRRASDMIKKDRPAPVPRPSPGLARQVDAQAFNDKWAAERKATQAIREARKAAFKKKRQAQSQNQARTQSRLRSQQK